MIIITDLIIIDHLISNLNKYNLLPTIVSKIAGWVANSVDPDETPHLRRLIWVYSLLRPVWPNTYNKVYMVRVVLRQVKYDQIFSDY